MMGRFNPWSWNLTFVPTLRQEYDQGHDSPSPQHPESRPPVTDQVSTTVKTRNDRLDAHIPCSESIWPTTTTVSDGEGDDATTVMKMISLFEAHNLSPGAVERAPGRTSGNKFSLRDLSGLDNEKGFAR